MQHRKGAGELRRAWALDIFCEDCGHTRRFQRRDLLELETEGFRTFQHLAAKLVCKHCRERQGQGAGQGQGRWQGQGQGRWQGQGHNVTLRPRWFKPARPGLH